MMWGPGASPPAFARRQHRPSFLPGGLADAARSSTPILQVENVSKSFFSNRSLFRKPTEFRAVNNVTFSLHENEFVGIVGESGSGKSTLARLVVGLERATEGRMTLAGRDVTANRPPDEVLPPRASFRWSFRTRNRL